MCKTLIISETNHKDMSQGYVSKLAARRLTTTICEVSANLIWNKGRTLQQYRETSTTGGCGLQDSSWSKLSRNHLPVLRNWPVGRDKTGKAELGTELRAGYIIQLQNSGSIMLSTESAKTGLVRDNQLSQTAIKEEQSWWTVCPYHQWSVPTTSNTWTPRRPRSSHQDTIAPDMNITVMNLSYLFF
ncbi:hypothetical protein AV530_010341 [Patagioenas fasciata monilis]|uniref:Uncharacterized protein n=1 Tax=Patagioenas fasciata monilis TaxID=372326 RepID=A0A1V4KEU9_PATFA|nr:hypothetical protein AV530_010341 [Patagioenas fasciata monilis]